MNPADVEWLLSDALAIVKNLEEKASDPQPQHRDRMLELLLMLANLHEYVAHHSVQLDRPAWSASARGGPACESDNIIGRPPSCISAAARSI